MRAREKGIWLLDASVVGLTEIKRDKTLTKTKRDRIISKIIKSCWDGHIMETINNLQPKHIIVIGIDVE